PPMRQVDIDQRRIEPFRWFRNAQRNDRLRIKLETETNDRFDAPEVLPEHDSCAWEHSVSQGIERASWQKQLCKRLLLQVIVTKLKIFSLRDEGGRWAALSVATDDKQLRSAHQRGQCFDT